MENLDDFELDNIIFERVMKMSPVYRLDAAWWQRIREWEPLTTDFSSLRPEELKMENGPAPDFWQRLKPWTPPIDAWTIKFNLNDGLKPLWWQKILGCLQKPKEAKTISEVIDSWQKERRSALKPRWWQRPFMRLPKLPD